LNVHDSAHADEFNLRRSWGWPVQRSPNAPPSSKPRDSSVTVADASWCWIDQDWKPSRASATRSTAPI
jgi:hypothetical protein